jgi:hypothetical protein
MSMDKARCRLKQYKVSKSKDRKKREFKQSLENHPLIKR